MVPKYSKLIDSVKFHPIKLIILIKNIIKVPVTTFLLLPPKYSIVAFIFLSKKGNSSSSTSSVPNFLS